MFFEMRFDLGILDLGEQSLPFGILVTLWYSHIVQILDNYSTFWGVRIFRYFTVHVMAFVRWYFWIGEKGQFKPFDLKR